MTKPEPNSLRPEPATALDFLIADLLGDVGKLDAAVRALRTSLDGTEARIQEAGVMASQAMTDGARHAILLAAQEAAAAEVRRVQAARVEAAALRSAFMVDANKALAEFKMVSVLRWRSSALFCLLAVLCGLGGAVVGFKLGKHSQLAATNNDQLHAVSCGGCVRMGARQSVPFSGVDS